MWSGTIGVEDKLPKAAGSSWKNSLPLGFLLSPYVYVNSQNLTKEKRPIRRDNLHTKIQPPIYFTYIKMLINDTPEGIIRS